MVRGTVTPTDIMINGNGDDRPMKQSECFSPLLLFSPTPTLMYIVILLTSASLDLWAHTAGFSAGLSVDLLEGAGLPGTPGNEDAGFFKRVGSGGSLHFRNVPNSPSRSVVKGEKH